MKKNLLQGEKYSLPSPNYLWIVHKLNSNQYSHTIFLLALIFSHKMTFFNMTTSIIILTQFVRKKFACDNTLKGFFFTVKIDPQEPAYSKIIFYKYSVFKSNLKTIHLHHYIYTVHVCLNNTFQMISQLNSTLDINFKGHNSIRTNGI